MASFEQIIKFENEKPKGVVRLVEANGFYRAYNHSAYLFHQAIARHKVTRKFVKNINQQLVYIGFPVDRLLERIGTRSHGMLDEFVKRELKVKHYGRYVDDVVIVSESKEYKYIKSMIEPIRAFLRGKLQLELSVNKTRVCNARHGVEFLGAFIKPYRTYPATRTLRRLRGRLKSLDWSERPSRIQARVNSMLGVLSHYDCWHVRKVLTWEACLREFGKVTDDCLRFHPDVLKFMVVSRVPRDRDGRASRNSKVGRGVPPSRGRGGLPRRLALPVARPTGEGNRV